MEAEDSNIEQYVPQAGCLLIVHRAWLAPSAADDLLQSMRREVDWQQRSINLFGKQVLQPRLIGWAATTSYTYSGLTLPPKPAPPCMSSVLAAVRRIAGVAFNHVLFNRYRDGNDGMGWHSDDEQELGRDPTVASVSLGASRDFQLKPRPRVDGHRHTLTLHHGDLLIMSGATQHNFVHALPKRAAATGERISLTFRYVTQA